MSNNMNIQCKIYSEQCIRSKNTKLKYNVNSKLPRPAWASNTAIEYWLSNPIWRCPSWLFCPTTVQFHYKNALLNTFGLQNLLKDSTQRQFFCWVWIKGRGEYQAYGTFLFLPHHDSSSWSEELAAALPCLSNTCNWTREMSGPMEAGRDGWAATVPQQQPDEGWSNNRRLHILNSEG